jgi:O-antigen/teichoic acid export membrane protein
MTKELLNKWFRKQNFPIYIAGNIFFQIFFIISEILVMRIVSVEIIGIWQWVLLLQGYALVSRMGILNAFNREYPSLLQLKSNKKSANILETTKFHIFISSAVQMLFFISLGLYYYSQNSSIETVILLLVAVFYVAVDSYVNLSESELRGRGEFKIIGLIKILFGVLLLVFVILPYFLDFKGFIFRIILIQMIYIVVHKKINTHFFDKKIQLHSKLWLELFTDGWRIWVWSYLKNFAQSLPRLYVLNFMGLTALGLFTPVAWVFLSFSLITGSINSFLYPLLSRKFAINEKDLVWQTFTIYLLISVCTLPIALLGYYLMPTIIAFLLPDYFSVVEALQLTILSSVFDIIVLTGSVWTASKDYYRMFTIVFIILFVRICSLFWVYTLDLPSLYDISLSMLASSVTIFLCITGIVLLQKVNCGKDYV